MGKSMKIEYSITLDIKHQHAQKRTIHYLDCNGNKNTFFINFPHLLFVRIQFENSIWFYPFRYQPVGLYGDPVNCLCSLRNVLPNISAFGMCMENAFQKDINSLIAHFWESPFVQYANANIELLDKFKHMQENPNWFVTAKTPEYDLFYRYRFITPEINSYFGKDFYIKESFFPKD